MDCGTLRMAGGNGAFILTFLLVLSHLVFFNAVPTSGTRDLLLYETQDSTASGAYTHQIINTLQDVMEKEELIIRGRLDLAHIDYAEAGPNNHHTPPPRG